MRATVEMELKGEGRATCSCMAKKIRKNMHGGRESSNIKLMLAFSAIYDYGFVV